MKAEAVYSRRINPARDPGLDAISRHRLYI